MTQFSKRHYQSIAQVMQETYVSPLDPDDESETITSAFEEWNNIRAALAQTFAADNPLFNRPLFLQACEPGRNVRARKVA